MQICIHRWQQKDGWMKHCNGQAVVVRTSLLNFYSVTGFVLSLLLLPLLQNGRNPRPKLSYAPATNDPSKQLSNAASQIYSDRRSNLLDGNVEKLWFLAYSIRLFNYEYWIIINIREPCTFEAWKVNISLNEEDQNIHIFSYLR